MNIDCRRFFSLFSLSQIPFNKEANAFLKGVLKPRSLFEHSITVDLHELLGSASPQGPLNVQTSI